MLKNAVSRSSYDVIIVGARCAGAATALLLARQGFKVLVVDKSRRGSDTLSTHALMRAGVLQLHRWGLLDSIRAAGTPAVSSSTFHYGAERVEVAIKPRDGVNALYAPRRTLLDPILSDAAADAGAEVVRGPRLIDLLRTSSGRVSGAIIQLQDGTRLEISAGLVVGADGVRSAVARLVGAKSLFEGTHATGVVYGYFEGIDAPGYNWHFTTEAGSGSIATNNGTLVFAGVPRDRFWREVRLDLESSFHDILKQSAPDLAESVLAARRLGRFRGYAGNASYLRQCWGPGWALVGDAGYFKDPVTAHGITDALRDAELLARAVTAGGDKSLAGYQELRNELSHRFFEITDAVASFDWDLATLQSLHEEMSEQMRQEVVHLSDLDPVLSAGSSTNALSRAS